MTEELQPPPAQPTEADNAYRDAMALIGKSRSGQRKTLIAMAAAAIVTLAAIGMIVAWSSRAAALPSSERAYYLGYASVPLVFGVLVGGIASIFPGRSWFRFFVAFSITGAFSLSSNLKKLAEFPTKVAASSLDARTQTLMNEQQQLASQLAQEPPFGARGLASKVAIARSEDRLTELLEVLSLSAQVEADRKAQQSDPAMDPKLYELEHQLIEARATDYRAARSALAFLRTSLGRWSFRDQRVQFDDPTDQARFNQMMLDLNAAEQKAAGLEAKLRAASGP